MKSGKKVLTILLFFACLLSAVILAYTPSYVPNTVSKGAELDSLIQLSFEDADLLRGQIRVFTIKVDSTFSRKVYRIEVPPSFSKTSFHLQLHYRLFPLGLNTPSGVVFPEEDMNIYVENEGTVFRTIRLITKTPTQNEDRVTWRKDEYY